MASELRTSPKHVLQAFHAVTVMGKADWRRHDREDRLRWPEELESETGGAAGGGRVELGELGEARRAALERAGVVVLRDYASAEGRAVLERWFHREDDPYDFLQVGPGPAPWEVFTLRPGDAGGLELWLAYERAGSLVGEPARDDFRLADLRPGAAVRVRVNGKHDLSMTGRRARTYRELDYVLQHLGVFDRFVLAPAHRLRTRKRVPLEAARLVDLRKRLY